MLQKLVISNYAIIDNLELQPDNHLNTITGETGAGKSIILGALSLILGERADTSVLINKEEKCIIEAHFDVRVNEIFAATIAQEDLDNEPTCIIRREISTSGKSRAFVNDTPVNLHILTKLTSILIDLQQQFGHLALENGDFQIDVVDAIAKTTESRKKYQALFTEHKKNAAILAALKEQQAQWQKEADYKDFLLQELNEAAFKDNEIEMADNQLKQLSHAERILNALQLSQNTLEEGEQPVINELKRMSQHLHSIADVMPDSASLQERVNAVWVEIKDIAAEIEVLKNKVNIDEALMLQLQERIDIGYKLLKKHGVQSTAALLSLQEALQHSVLENGALNERINTLESEQAKQYAALMNAAAKLSADRKTIVSNFEKQINTLLALVGMPNAVIKFDITTLQTPNKFGIDEVKFLLDANKSGQYLSLQKAASGGEMSRIMLCIKSLTAAAMQLPTLVFDEVDTGISGEAARQVAILLRNLAKHHQVICITHQPQVAAKGTTHFYVYKEEGKSGMIKTRVKELEPNERVEAIARMIGGEQPSNAALQNAKELVGQQ